MSIKKGLGYSPLTDRVFFGKQNPEKRIWVGDKIDVTQDFMAVAFEYFKEGTIRDIGSSDGSSNLLFNIKNEEAAINKAINYLNALLRKKKTTVK